MNVIADICIVPIGVGVSVSKYVATCEKILKDAGLNPKLHAYGTNVEGSWDNVFTAFKKCHNEIHNMGAPRITTTIRVGTRVDREQSIQDKLNSVNEKLFQ